MSILVVNAGGVTLELTVVGEGNEVVDRVQVDPWAGRDVQPIGDLASRHKDLTAVGHRIVHGGIHSQPTLIDGNIIRELEDVSDLAPIHQQRALLTVAAARTTLPTLPHVACFDTAFHLTIPDAAAVYALPAEWRQRWPLRRSGFHGLSHQHVAHTVPALANGRADRRVVSCHLGSGASLCAILDGRSIDTTMGRTPLEGLTMVTRSGTVDPSMLIWLLRGNRLSLDELEDGLNHHSGLAGLSGGNGDMREVLRDRASGDPSAAVAFDVYIHHLRKGIGAMAASLGGIDVLAFTGGVGQHLPAVRRATVEGLAHLGVFIDHQSNDEATTDADVSARSARARCVVVATGEFRSIATLTRQVVDRNQRSPHRADAT